MRERYPPFGYEWSEVGYTDEQLLDGVLLRPDQTIQFEPDRPPDAFESVHYLEDRTRVRGKVAGEINVGTEYDHTVGLFVVRYYEGKPGQGVILILNPQAATEPTGRRHSLHLWPGTMLPVGRSIQRGVFPETVEDVHCWVGMDETGQLLVKNGQRRNATFVRQC